EPDRDGGDGPRWPLSNGRDGCGRCCGGHARTLQPIPLTPLPDESPPKNVRWHPDAMKPGASRPPASAGSLLGEHLLVGHPGDLAACASRIDLVDRVDLLGGIAVRIERDLAQGDLVRVRRVRDRLPNRSADARVTARVG